MKIIVKPKVRKVAFEELDFQCGRCTCKIYGLGDDYYCPICNNLFCFGCIGKHGCKVDIIPSDHLHGRWKVIKTE